MRQVIPLVKTDLVEIKINLYDIFISAKSVSTKGIRSIERTAQRQKIK